MGFSFKTEAHKLGHKLDAKHLNKFGRKVGKVVNRIDKGATKYIPVV